MSTLGRLGFQSLGLNFDGCIVVASDTGTSYVATCQLWRRQYWTQPSIYLLCRILTTFTPTVGSAWSQVCWGAQYSEAWESPPGEPK